MPCRCTFLQIANHWPCPTTGWEMKDVYKRQAQVSAPATNATAVSPASIGHSAGPDLVAEAARAVLKLLLMHKQSGGTIPPDVSELLSQFGRQN